MTRPKASARPPISVVFATRQPSAHVGSHLQTIEEQVRAVGGEVVVVDGCGQALPGEPDDVLSWVKSPGSDVYELRALGAARARGDVVAYTEDHCAVAPDWCERILRAHRERPDVEMIAGAVVNGSEERVIDRANFLMVHAANLPPLRDTPDDWVPSSANVSFKRAVMPDRVPEPGWVEYVLTAELIHSGRVVLDDRIRVTHVQSYGVFGTVMNHYHAARSVAGLLRVLSPTVGRRVLARAALAFPYRQPRRALRTVRRKPGCGPGLGRLLVPMIVLAGSAAIGLFMGAVAGVGASRQRLR